MFKCWDFLGKIGVLASFLQITLACPCLVCKKIKTGAKRRPQSRNLQQLVHMAIQKSLCLAFYRLSFSLKHWSWDESDFQSTGRVWIVIISISNIYYLYSTIAERTPLLRECDIRQLPTPRSLQSKVWQRKPSKGRVWVEVRVKGEYEIESRKWNRGIGVCVCVEMGVVRTYSQI